MYREINPNVITPMDCKSYKIASEMYQDLVIRETENWSASMAVKKISLDGIRS